MHGGGGGYGWLAASPGGAEVCGEGNGLRNSRT